MTDFLLREESPLTPEQWERIDETIVQVARRALVGRRFIDVYGPVGAGLQVVATDVFRGAAMGGVDPLGEGADEAVGPFRRRYLELPILYKDFFLHWRDLESANRFGLPLDTSAAAAASLFCSNAEDDLVFNGRAELGMPGLRTVEGRKLVPLGDWGAMGGAFTAVVRSIEALVADGYFGPYAVIVSPRLYAAMNRVYENTGVLEIEQVRKLAADGVYHASVLPEPTGLVVATGSQNMDLAVGQDLTAAYLESSRMNHRFRVFSTLALRIKRPGAIVHLS